VDDVELLHETEMAVLILERTPLVERIETRANELHAESERARAGAERARVVNQTDVERLFGIVRDQSAQINHLTTRVAKLEGGASTVRPSPAPYAPRSNAPQLLGQPAGMGSHSGHRFGSSNSGVRRLVSAAAPVPIKG
jgi:hypothetical protein